MTTADNDPLLAQLNPAQQAAVTYNDGPQLVIAGAGAGKTRVITYKIAYLIREGISPYNILALTFTNKAANEMKGRIARLVGEEAAQHISMGTFHSIFARILRREATAIGYTPSFTIYDDTDTHSLLRSIIRERGLDEKIYKPSAVAARLSLAKNNMVDHVAYNDNPSFFKYDSERHQPLIGSIYATYEERCKRANAIDFDNLLLLTYRLLHDNDTIRQKWEGRFQFILVDEYQDTNRAQHAVLHLLTRAQQHICVVGDDAQSIYAFRGANLENILLFRQTYPTARLFKLEQNYRSTQRIVKAANSLIAHNSRQIKKEVFSQNAIGDKLRLIKTASDMEEAQVVCREIRRLAQQDNVDNDAFAVLYRTNAQSRSFEDAFRKAALPYRIYGGISFYQRKEIKDVLAYFRLTINNDDEEALRRIINYPARGIGATTMERITTCAQQNNVSLWQVCADADGYHLPVHAGTRQRLRQFVALITSFREQLENTDAYVLGQDIIRRSGVYDDVYATHDEDSIVRQENITELGNALHGFVQIAREEGRSDETSLSAFLQEVSLQTDIESDSDKSKARVSLMTIHAAKGLEFPTVFIVGMEENIFPSARTTESLRDLEEERRLLYVAITRAARHCLLTCAKNRWRYGKMESYATSRFIQDIDSQYLDIDDGTSLHSKTYHSAAPSVPLSPRRNTSFSPRQVPVSSPKKRLIPLAKTASAKQEETSYNGLHAGMTIEHDMFGIGKVLSVKGAGYSARAMVEFRNMGVKQLILKFSKYTIVEE